MPAQQAPTLADLGSRNRGSTPDVNSPNISLTQAVAGALPIALSDERDAAILAAIRTGATHQRDAHTHRRRLQHQARAFRDFNHFQRLCVRDLHQAFTDDRAHHTRMTKYRRLAWLAMFRHFAAHAHLHQDVRITALNRQGYYTCHLIDQTPPDDWEKFVRLGERFGIHEDQLHALCPAPQAGAKAQPHKA